MALLVAVAAELSAFPSWPSVSGVLPLLEPMGTAPRSHTLDVHRNAQHIMHAISVMALL